MKIRNSDKVAAKLEDSILRGDYKDGEKLNEVALSNEFGVSRTPIREALQKLTQSGLVEQIPSRGVFVRQPGPVELMELFEMMAELEAACARLAAIRISKEALEELRQANALCKEAMLAEEADSYYYANIDFHMTIYRESGNSVLEQETKRLHQRLKPFRRSQLQVRGRLPQSMSEHEKIVDALAVGDAELAANLIRGHVAIQGEKFNHLMASFKEVS